MAPHDIGTTARTATSLWGPEGVHLAGNADAVDGHQPKVVLEPRDAATAASMPSDFQPSSVIGVLGSLPLMNLHGPAGVTLGCP